MSDPIYPPIPIPVETIKALALSCVDDACALLRKDNPTPKQRLSAERALARAFRFGNSYHFKDELLARGSKHGINFKEIT